MLALSEEQMVNLMEIRKALQETIQPMVRERNDLARQLREAVRSESVDEAAISDLRAQIAAKTEEINATREESRLAARILLTNEQLDTLSELEGSLAMQHAARQAIMFNLIEGPESGRGFNRGMARIDFMGRRGRRGTESSDR
jgi:Spy/CpxP family protein refolding chaperone